jgi:transposase
VPAVPSSIIEPIWCQFEALIPPVLDGHPLGCHRPRIPDRIVFDKLIQVLVFGAAYVKIADASCSATTIRTRRDEWIVAGIFAELEQICLNSYDKIIGLDLSNLSVDGCIVKAPCGGDAAGQITGRSWETGHETVAPRRRQRDTAGLRDRWRELQRLTPARPHIGEAQPLRVRPAGTDHRASGRRIRLWQKPRSVVHPGLRLGHQHQG